MTSGGDVSFSDLDYGAHLIWDLNSFIGLHAGITQFDDRGPHGNGDLRVTSASISGRLTILPASPLRPYFMGGANFTYIDADLTPLELSSASFERSKDEHALANGMTVRQAEYYLETLGVDGELDVENHIGITASAGIEWELEEGFLIFTDYSYTWSEFEADLKIHAPDIDYSAQLGSDYDFGLLRVGVSLRL